ncbi:hypothetical protein ACXR2T_07985 [Leucobacter sp. HY1910]
MSAAQTIQHAIERLEKLQRDATPGPWIARFDGDEPHVIETADDLPDEIRVGGSRWVDSPGVYHTTDVIVDLDVTALDTFDVRTAAANAELVAALAGAVGPILDILQQARRLLASGLVGDSGPEIRHATALAAAILSEGRSL